MLRAMRRALHKAKEEGGDAAVVELCLAADALLRRRDGIPSCLLPATASAAKQTIPHAVTSPQEAAQRCLLAPLAPLPQSRREACARWGLTVAEMSSSEEREEAAALVAKTLADMTRASVRVHYEMARLTPFTQEELSLALRDIGWATMSGGHLSALLSARLDMRSRFQEERSLPAAAMLRLTLRERLIGVWREEWQDESRYAAAVAADPMEGTDGRAKRRLGGVVL